MVAPGRDDEEPPFLIAPFDLNASWLRLSNAAVRCTG